MRLNLVYTSETTCWFFVCRSSAIVLAQSPRCCLCPRQGSCDKNRMQCVNWHAHIAFTNTVDQYMQLRGSPCKAMQCIYATPRNLYSGKDRGSPTQAEGPARCTLSAWNLLRWKHCLHVGHKWRSFQVPQWMMWNALKCIDASCNMNTRMHTEELWVVFVYRHAYVGDMYEYEHGVPMCTHWGGNFSMELPKRLGWCPGYRAVFMVHVNGFTPRIYRSLRKLANGNPSNGRSSC